MNDNEFNQYIEGKAPELLSEDSPEARTAFRGLMETLLEGTPKEEWTESLLDERFKQFTVNEDIEETPLNTEVSEN